MYSKSEYMVGVYFCIAYYGTISLVKMNVSLLASPVQSILKEYYENKSDDNSSTLVFGSNTIEVVITESTFGSIDLSQYNEIMESINVMGVYSLVIAYPQKYRLYLACLFGMSSSDKEIPDHFGPLYASKVLPYTISKTMCDEDTIRFRSAEFVNYNDNDAISDIRNILESYGDSADDFDISSVKFVEVSKIDTTEETRDELDVENIVNDNVESSENDNTNDENDDTNDENDDTNDENDDTNDENDDTNDDTTKYLEMSITCYCALIAKYLIDYVEEMGEEGLAFVITYAFKAAASSISKQSIVKVIISAKNGSSVNIKQISTITSEALLGISTKSYDEKIEGNNTADIVISVLALLLFLGIMGTATVLVSKHLVNKTKSKHN